MLPSVRYRQLLDAPGFRADPLQAQAVARLDALYTRALTPTPWYSRRKERKGIYLWGQVGIGKSLLTDLFCDCLPPEVGKTRQHYQHFIAGIQRRLNAMSGQANPLAHIGKELAAQYRVICLDELYLTDLGDAMIVYNLFASLFREGVVLLITSNFAPEQLYKDELQPAIFQPAIRLIRAHTEEVHLTTVDDYRRLYAADHPTWLVGSEAEFAALFDAINAELQHSSTYSRDALEIQQHSLRVHRHHKQLAWFSFHELCELPRSAKDYLLLCQRFKILLVSGVPQLGSAEHAPQPTAGTEDSGNAGARRQYSSSENAQRRFISLVDECYDQGIKLHLQAEFPLESLYAGGRLSFEFQRTLSRLWEMQSTAYRERALREA